MSRTVAAADDGHRAALAALSAALAAPSDELPSTRCVSERALKALLRASPSARTPPDFIQWLVDARLAQPLALTTVGPGHEPPTIFVIAIGGASTADAVDPLELLLAAEPHGFASYFSALSFHELTTQSPPAHYVALHGRSPMNRARQPLAASSPRGGKPDPHGSPLFTFDGTPYYVTKRTEPSVAVQRRFFDAQFLLRVTTLEQTLLDTLKMPLRCGGEEVVFEAWEGAVDRIDPAKMSSTLLALGDGNMARRVGAMYAQLGRSLPMLVATTVQELATTTSEAEAEVHLLRGFRYTSFNAQWRVHVP
jgi:predicted transcriptional regulator of viral defense system